MEIGTVIRRLREEKGITQLELAKAIGISSGAVSMYEINNRIPKKELLEAIADYFNVDINYLFGYTELSPYILPPDIGMALTDIQKRPVLAELIKEECKMSDKELEKISTFVKMLKD